MLMSDLSEKDLKAKFIKELDKFDKEKLFILYQFMSRIIANDLAESVTKDWDTGKVNRETIQKAVDEYRKRPTGGALGS